jgi:hypothetical protein
VFVKINGNVSVFISVLDNQSYTNVTVSLLKAWDLGQLSQYSDRLQNGWLGFDHWQEQEIFLFSAASRLAPGPSQPPLCAGALAPDIKQPGCEADHSSQSNAEVKNGGAICCHGVVLN